ncbi:MAG: acyltransferase [Bdellovibrionota bacterium]
MVDGMKKGESVVLGGKLVVGNDVYIGARSTIMPVTIGEGCVIGAGSFVNKDCEPWGIYVGSPAKKIGEKTSLNDEQVRRHHHCLWWQQTNPEKNIKNFLGEAHHRLRH